MNSKNWIAAGLLGTVLVLTGEPLSELAPVPEMTFHGANKQFGTMNVFGNENVKFAEENGVKFIRIGKNGYFFSENKSGKTPAGNARTLSLLIRLSGSKGYVMGSEIPMFRYDFNLKDGGMTAALVDFPPGKDWQSLDLPENERTMKASEWHHIVFTVNPEGEAALYIDGELKAKKVMKELAGAAIPAGSAKFTIANWGGDNTSDDFSADIARMTYLDELMPTPGIAAQADEWLSAAGE